MDKENAFNANRLAVKVRRELNQEHSKAIAKNKLASIMVKKVKTTMIGAVAACEEAMGELWGHGKEISELTPEEMAWREIWEDLRNAILNKGNGQIRSIRDELALYAVEYQGYKYQFMKKE